MNFGRSFRKDRLVALAAILLMLGAAGALVLFWLALTPTRLVVAAPAGEPVERMLRTFSETLRQRGSGVRLDVLTVPTYADAADALQNRRVELAAVRSDVHYPTNAGSVAILKERALLIAAPAVEDASLADIKPRRIGVYAPDASDQATLTALLAHFDFDASAITVFQQRAQAVDALGAGEIGALAFLAVAGDKEAAGLLRDAQRALSAGVTLLPVEEAESLANQYTYLSPFEAPAAAFSTRPSLPAESLQTVAVSTRLAAAFAVDRGTVATLAERLFATRVRLARTNPEANLMKAPETEGATSALLPNHAGAIDYFEREQMTFMDRWGDWIWLGFFGLGGASSAMAWLARLVMRKRREAVISVLDRVTQTLEAVRKAQTVEELDGYTLELDRVVIAAMAQTSQGLTNARDLAAFVLALDAVRAAINERRRMLARQKPPAAPSPATAPDAALVISPALPRSA